MLDNVQFIRSPKGEELVVMPRAVYNKLARVSAEAAEDARDLREARKVMARIKTGKEPLIPGPVAKLIMDGAHPVKAWRQYRKLTAAALAEQAGITRAYVTQIETGARPGGIATLRKLAKALKVSVDQLLAD